MVTAPPHIIVVGAGMGGLATAIRLGSAGARVTVLETADGPGGKMRTLPSAAGPVDAGPTVVTMRHQFDALFELTGKPTENWVHFSPEPLLARHWWPDGSSLDLFADQEASVEAIKRFAGLQEAMAFRSFTKRAARLFKAFETPMMETAKPTLFGMFATTAPNPRLAREMSPLSSLASMLKRTFKDPRLQQLFGRYATYVGGHPLQTPAVLQLIWHAEASGVWRVEGGMSALADALKRAAESLGVEFRFATPVRKIETQAGHVNAVQTASGDRILADAVVFNGDPAALFEGILGPTASQAVSLKTISPRSL